MYLHTFYGVVEAMAQKGGEKNALGYNEMHPLFAADDAAQKVNEKGSHSHRQEYSTAYLHRMNDSRERGRQREREREKHEEPVFCIHV